MIGANPAPRGPHPVPWISGLALVIAAYAWAAHEYLLVLLVPYGDAWAHLASIRRTIELGPFPGDVFYGVGPTAPYYSLSHILFALASRASGIAPHELWVAAPTLIAAVDIGFVFLFLRRLTGDLRIAVLGASVELLLHVPGQNWAALSFPSVIAIAPRSLCWYAYLRARTSARLGWLLAAGAALGTCFAVHLFVGGLCAIGLVLLELSLHPRPRRSTPALFLVFAVGATIAAPWFGNLLSASMQRPQQIKAVFGLDRQSWSISVAGASLQILTPSVFGATLAPALWVPVLIGLAVCATRAAGGRASTMDRFALLATAAALLLVLTPLYGLAILALGAWSPRLVLIAPYGLLFGLGIAATIDFAGDPRRSAWVWRSLQAATAAGFAYLAFTGAYELYERTTIMPELDEALRQNGPLESWDLGDRLAKLGPLPEVVLADTETAYLLPYLIGSYVVAMPAGHGSPYADHLPREKAVKDFYNPATTIEQRHAILDEYGADTVAVGGDGLLHEPGTSAQLIDRLRQDPAFIEIGCCERVRFFRYRPAPAQSPTP